MRVFKLGEPIFKSETLFILGCSFETFARLLKRRYRCDAGDFIGQCGQTFRFPDRSPWRCVWTSTTETSVILHEVFHLVTRICQDKGVPIVAHHPNGESGDETATYLFEYYATRVLRRGRKS